MDTLKKERLISAGIDVDGVLERFMGNESLLERMLKKFVSDGNYARLLTAVEQKDPEEALRASHTLKGLCGNLSMTALLPLFTRQVELFRAGDPEGAYALLPEITSAYLRVIEAINSLTA